MILDKIGKFRQAKDFLHFYAISKLHLEIFIGGVKEIPDQVVGAWWVGYDVTGPIAFGGIHPSKQHAKTAYLCRVGVVHRARGRGLQKKLIQIRERWARKQGIEWIVTDTAPDNPASSNSLISCGYKLWRPKNRWAGYSPALYWRKRL